MALISNIGITTFIDPSGSAGGSSAPPPQLISANQDQVHLASIPLTSQVEQQLEAKQPPNLQAVLGDAIRNLRAAASQTPNPIDSAYLSGLADRFERLQESGDAASSSATVNLTA